MPLRIAEGVTALAKDIANDRYRAPPDDYGATPRSFADAWRSKPNYWRAITRRGAGVPVAIGTAENCTRGQTHVIWQNLTMTRNDVLVWLSLAGLFAAYCATLWVFFPLGDWRWSSEGTEWSSPPAPQPRSTTSAQACLTGPIGAAWLSAPPTKPPRSCRGTVGSRRTTCRSAALKSNQQSWDNPKRITSGRDGAERSKMAARVDIRHENARQDDPASFSWQSRTCHRTIGASLAN